MGWLRDILGRRLAAWLSARALVRPDPPVATGCGQGDCSGLFLGPQRKLLHVGCGPATMSSAGPGFQSGDWREIRLDIDPEGHPDILGTLLDMSDVPDKSVDAVFTSHTLEHLYSHEIPLALTEMRRVLRADGIALSAVPDLQAAARMIADDRLFDVAYESPAGSITPFDMVYSYRGFVGRDRPYMAHHSGFTLSTLVQAFRDAGFCGVIGVRREPCFDLWVLATELPQSDESLGRMAGKYVPGYQLSE